MRQPLRPWHIKRDKLYAVRCNGKTERVSGARVIKMMRHENVVFYARAHT